MNQLVHHHHSKNTLKLEAIYPYTYVRVNVMRSKLLSRHDYDKLMKMQYSEIAKFMQDTEYKAEIDELAVRHSGQELIEAALSKSLAKSFSKLRAICPSELRLLVDAYLLKYDILNLKTIIRGLFTGASPEYIKKLFIPAGTFNEQALAELLKKQTIEDVLKSVPFLEYRSIRQFYEQSKEKNTLFPLENALDRFYYTFIIIFSERIPQQEELFRKFLLSQIESANISTIARLLKEGMQKSEIEKFIFFTGIREHDIQIRRMLTAKSIDQLASHAMSRQLRKAISKSADAFKTGNSLIEFERQLSRHLLEKAILLVHQHPLSIDVLLGFMFEKEIEVQNLMRIVKGRELGLPEETIARDIIAV